ncbi:leucine-rich_repeat domain-containing protein [Hexamita inflata]|uniref:Leucine-rich repeat domain-containing protein n=1 Tax=Hexamita inflata TaxID=28002 RepID=A0AA86TU16_9EUKA|nr:leucine-rich repeat domain-containing protein [Hexamita inflata]
MKQNQEIRSKEDLLDHFGSSKQLEILDLQQMKDLLEINVPPEVWEDASNRNLLSFSSEFVWQTKELTLDKYSTSIQHIYLISCLTYLTELNLSKNKVSDLSVISKLKNLKKLDLQENRIKDISALQYLPNLTHLNLFGNYLTSYTLTLPNLVELLLSYNWLLDNSGLQHSPKLQKLYLSGTKTTNLIFSTISQLFGLKYLDLMYNNISDITYLSNFVDLQILELGGNQQLLNIGPLKFCTQLTSLSIFETRVADIWPLQFMKYLKTLNMFKTQIVDLHPLQHLYNLEYISAHDSRITDVSPLSKLTKLTSMTIWDNTITNREILKHHKNYSLYYFSEQQVPTPNELKFYNKILFVHSSHKYIRKIQTENRVSKFRESLTRQKEQINLKINEQIQVMNKKIKIILSQNYYTDQ